MLPFWLKLSTGRSWVPRPSGVLGELELESTVWGGLETGRWVQGSGGGLGIAAATGGGGRPAPSFSLVGFRVGGTLFVRWDIRAFLLIKGSMKSESTGRFWSRKGERVGAEKQKPSQCHQTLAYAWPWPYEQWCHWDFNLPSGLFSFPSKFKQKQICHKQSHGNQFFHVERESDKKHTFFFKRKIWFYASWSFSLTPNSWKDDYASFYGSYHSEEVS